MRNRTRDLLKKGSAFITSSDHWTVFMGVECWLLCVVRRMFGAQVCRVVGWLFGFGVVGLLVVLIVPLFLPFLAMPGLCCSLRVTHAQCSITHHKYIRTLCLRPIMRTSVLLVETLPLLLPDAAILIFCFAYMPFLFRLLPYVHIRCTLRVLHIRRSSIKAVVMH